MAIDRKPLPTAKPEESGISSRNLLAFYKRLQENRVNTHSVIMLRHGKIFTEAYWWPFHKGFAHRYYSTSKTFVSMAIGVLVDQGRISLNDRIVTYFADKLPSAVPPELEAATIRDLLMMASPYNGTTYRHTEADWLASFFNWKGPIHQPGTEFHYDTSGTYVLNVLVERLTGKPYMHFLWDTVLHEIGFTENVKCILAPEGNTWGGSGVLATTRDMAKFAQLLLQKGRWGDKQLISEDYVTQATSVQIDNSNRGSSPYMDHFGYGYKIWRTWRNGFALIGMGGQLAIVLPDLDFIFVAHSDIQGASGEYDSIVEPLDALLETISDTALPADPEAYSELRDYTGDLAPLPPVSVPAEEMQARVNNVTYDLNPNAMGISKFTLSFAGDTVSFHYSTNRGERALLCGTDHYQLGGFPEMHYYGDRIGTPANRPFPCTSAAVWTAPDTLTIRLFIIDQCFGNMTATFKFEGDEVTVSMRSAAEWFLKEYNGEAKGRKAE